MIQQYPLNWPAGWQRSQNPGFPKFESRSIDWESRDIVRELKLMNATNIIINSNMQYKADGMPYTRQKVHDTGVAVYFTLNGEDQCIPCDKWYRLEDNLRAIAKTINAMRGIERWGAKEMVNAAFRGFKALPSSIITPPPTDKREHRDWWVVLGVDKYANVLDVKAAYREALKLNHPDAGGSDSDLMEVRNAFEEWKAA